MNKGRDDAVGSDDMAWWVIFLLWGEDLYLNMTLNDQVTIPYIGNNNVNVSYSII